jgi:hypothetical protein
MSTEITPIALKTKHNFKFGGAKKTVSKQEKNKEYISSNSLNFFMRNLEAKSIHYLRNQSKVKDRKGSVRNQNFNSKTSSNLSYSINEATRQQIYRDVSERSSEILQEEGAREIVPNAKFQVYGGNKSSKENIRPKRNGVK